MSQAVTFNEVDWAQLSATEKTVLAKLARYGFGDISPEPLGRASGVGQKSVDALIEKGLAVEDEPGLHGRYFKLTAKGVLASYWIGGCRMRVYPQKAPAPFDAEALLP